MAFICTFVTQLINENEQLVLMCESGGLYNWFTSLDIVGLISYRRAITNISPGG